MYLDSIFKQTSVASSDVIENCIDSTKPCSVNSEDSSLSNMDLSRIYLARERLKKIIRTTDLIYAPSLSKDCEIFLKTENLQITGSFKARGAAFKIGNLTVCEKKNGVVACSAGNHAQGVALTAQKEGIDCTIFMPSNSPLSKIEATKGYGAEVRLIEGVYDDAYLAAKEFQKQSGAAFIHPFDDCDVIAGQGTIALEILEQMPDVEAVVVPIGGGGLASGIAYVIKTLCPNCKVYGAQASGASSMLGSFNQKRILSLQSISTFADGIAVKKPGEITYALCCRYLDDIVSVDDSQIAAAIVALLEKQKMIAEGAGAVSVAAAMFDKLPIKGKKTVCIVSGGNIDINILSKVINRGLFATGRICEIGIELADKAGQLRDISTVIATCGANIVKITHSNGNPIGGVNDCVVLLSLETRNHEHISEIKQTLIQKGYTLKI